MTYRESTERTIERRVRYPGCRSEGQRRATAHLRKGTPQKASGEPSADAGPLARLSDALERYTDARAGLLRATEELGDALTEAERYLADLGVVE